jgi:hypothetical protein
MSLGINPVSNDVFIMCARGLFISFIGVHVVALSNLVDIQSCPKLVLGFSCLLYLRHQMATLNQGRNYEASSVSHMIYIFY